VFVVLGWEDPGKTLERPWKPWKDPIKLDMSVQDFRSRGTLLEGTVKT
jgi:hypothetical protein